MKDRMTKALILVLTLALLLPTAALAVDTDTWCWAEEPEGYYYYAEGLAITKLSLREKPFTSTADLGTYYMQGYYVDLLARHWDDVNQIWWIYVGFYYNDNYIKGWTGLQRLDETTFDLQALPEVP